MVRSRAYGTPGAGGDEGPTGSVICADTARPESRRLFSYAARNITFLDDEE
jgi:hypothetical protein